MAKYKVHVTVPTGEGAPFGMKQIEVEAATHSFDVDGQDGLTLYRDDDEEDVVAFFSGGEYKYFLREDSE